MQNFSNRKSLTSLVWSSQRPLNRIRGSKLHLRELCRSGSLGLLAFSRCVAPAPRRHRAVALNVTLSLRRKVRMHSLDLVFILSFEKSYIKLVESKLEDSGNICPNHWQITREIIHQRLLFKFLKMCNEGKILAEE